MYRFILQAKSINGFLIVFVLVQFISCTAFRGISGDNIVIEMEKTPCYGQCPVYTIQIDDRGKGLLEGVENIPYLGLHSFRLSRDELEGLKIAFEQIGFFRLEDRYYAHVTDLPTTYLTFRSGSQEKRIMDYHGAPAELKKLEKQIAALVLSKKMKKAR